MRCKRFSRYASVRPSLAPLALSSNMPLVFNSRIFENAPKIQNEIPIFHYTSSPPFLTHRANLQVCTRGTLKQALHAIWILLELCWVMSPLCLTWHLATACHCHPNGPMPRF